MARQEWKFRSGRWRQLSLHSFVFRPSVAARQDLAVGGHSRLSETNSLRQLHFDADNLLHAVILKIRIFRSERRLRVYSQDIPVESLFRI